MSPSLFVDPLLLVLLGTTLFHARRLERALGVLRRDRDVLEQLIGSFNESTTQAEQSVARLRAAAEGTGRGLSREMEAAQRVRDDLHFLSERGDRLAERLERAVRGARMVGDLGEMGGFGHAPERLTDIDIHATGGFARPGLPPLLAAPCTTMRITPVSSMRPYGSADSYDDGRPASPAAMELTRPASAPIARTLAVVDGGSRAGPPRQRSLSEQALLRALRGAR